MPTLPRLQQAVRTSHIVDTTDGVRR